MIVILGSGPSGLIAANYLKSMGEDFKIISSGYGGFHQVKVGDVEFTLGQRTLFYSEALYDFIGLALNHNFTPSIQELTDKIAVEFQGSLHGYPIQNNLGKFSLLEKLKIWWSYLRRNKILSERGNYADWVRGNYGNWLADNIILPHTHKTLKEDLYTIQSKNYGKKVVKMHLWGSPEPVQEITDIQDIFKCLSDNVESHIIKGRVVNINIESKCIYITDHNKENYAGYITFKYDKLINTIALPKFVSMLEPRTNVLTIAEYSLRWNNMFIGAMVVPTSFINTDKSIVYFPERKYIFSKVYFQRKNGYTVITCEHSFRRNDLSLYTEKLYQDKILEQMEDDLKKSGLVKSATFLSYGKIPYIITPAYIICDEEYENNNSFLQGWLNHHDIYSIGRFAEWRPNLRVEHTIGRMTKLCKDWFGERFYLDKDYEVEKEDFSMSIKEVCKNIPKVLKKIDKSVVTLKGLEGGDKDLSQGGIE